MRSFEKKRDAHFPARGRGQVGAWTYWYCILVLTLSSCRFGEEGSFGIFASAVVAWGSGWAIRDKVGRSFDPVLSTASILPCYHRYRYSEAWVFVWGILLSNGLAGWHCSRLYDGFL